MGTPLPKPVLAGLWEVASPVVALWPPHGGGGGTAAVRAGSDGGVLTLSPTAVALAAGLIVVQALVSIK